MTPARWAIVAMGALAVACHRAAPEEAATEAAVPVEVAEAHVGTLTATVRATGTVDPAPGGDWMVTAPAAARISQIRFAAGDRVRKADVLVRFDAPTLRSDLATRSSELAQAGAQVENARRNHTRLTELLEKGIASRKEVEDAKKDLMEAEAKLHEGGQTRSAAADLASRATAVAPFAGVIAQRWHNPGDLVDANEHVVRLVDPRRLEVTAAVPVADAARIRVGRAAKVAVPSSGEEATLPARVAAGAAAVDTATGTATVRLALEGVLPVGTAVQVEIAAEERKDAVVVPATAVVRDQDKAAVYVVGPDKHAHRREITLGLISGDEVQVLSGVRAGETVVVKGHEELPDGALVTVEKE